MHSVHSLCIHSLFALLLPLQCLTRLFQCFPQRINPLQLSLREDLAAGLHALSAVEEDGPDDDAVTHDGLVVVDVRGAGWAEVAVDGISGGAGVGVAFGGSCEDSQLVLWSSLSWFSRLQGLRKAGLGWALTATYPVDNLVHRVWSASQLPTCVAMAQDVFWFGDFGCPDTRTAMAAAVEGACTHRRFFGRGSKENAISDVYRVSSSSESSTHGHTYDNRVLDQRRRIARKVQVHRILRQIVIQILLVLEFQYESMRQSFVEVFPAAIFT